MVGTLLDISMNVCVRKETNVLIYPAVSQSVSQSICPSAGWLVSDFMNV